MSKALDILELLQAENQQLALEAIYRKTKISKTTVYRILKTFVHRGYVSQSQDGLYRHVSRAKKMRFGFAGQSTEMPFSNAVTASLKLAAAASGVDLLILDNSYHGETAIRNAEQFVEKGVDLIIEFQVEQDVRAYHRRQDRRREHTADRNRYPSPARHVLRSGQLPRGS